MPGVNSSHWDSIVAALTPGDIIDPSGLATTRLVEVTGHKSTNALAKILHRMEDAGVIERDISGRRTSRIGLTDAYRAEMSQNGYAGVPIQATPDESVHTSAAPVQDSSGIDYDLLAAALLAKALKAQEAQENSAAFKDALSRAQRAEARASIAEADASAARAKVAELEAMLRQMEKNIQVLSTAAEKPQRNGNSVASLISPAEKRALRELEQMLRQPPTARG
jgi:hypothetical protein